MHRARDSRPFLLGVLSFAILVAVAGCTLVGDVTGVTIDKANPSFCIKSCVSSTADQVHAEIVTHTAAIAGCQSLSESERRACMDSEASRHQAAMARIAAGRVECMNNCHRQGSGSAG